MIFFIFIHLSAPERGPTRCFFTGSAVGFVQVATQNLPRKLSFPNVPPTPLLVTNDFCKSSGGVGVGEGGGGKQEGVLEVVVGVFWKTKESFTAVLF